MNDKRLRIDLDDHLALMMVEINSLAAVEGAIESHRLVSFCSNLKSWVVSLNSVYPAFSRNVKDNFRHAIHVQQGTDIVRQLITGKERNIAAPYHVQALKQHVDVVLIAFTHHDKPAQRVACGDALPPGYGQAATLRKAQCNPPS